MTRDHASGSVSSDAGSDGGRSASREGGSSAPATPTLAPTPSNMRLVKWPSLARLPHYGSSAPSPRPPSPVHPSHSSGLTAGAESGDASAAANSARHTVDLWHRATTASKNERRTTQRRRSCGGSKAAGGSRGSMWGSRGSLGSASSAAAAKALAAADQAQGECRYGGLLELVAVQPATALAGAAARRVDFAELRVLDEGKETPTRLRR